MVIDFSAFRNWKALWPRSWLPHSLTHSFSEWGGGAVYVLRGKCCCQTWSRITLWCGRRFCPSKRNYPKPQGSQPVHSSRQVMNGNHNLHPSEILRSPWCPHKLVDHVTRFQNAYLHVPMLQSHWVHLRFPNQEPARRAGSLVVLQIQSLKKGPVAAPLHTQGHWVNSHVDNPCPIWASSLCLTQNVSLR